LKRDIAALSDQRHDLLVIGGGIYGVAAAREASLRGLRVALVERDDFGAGTSWNSFKTLHGGIRYLQQLDLARLRASLRSQRRFLRLAPHLVEPLRFALPSRGWGSRGPVALGLGRLAYAALSLDRNRGVAPERRLPGARLLSRGALHALAPELSLSRANGALAWWDAQLRSSERVVLEFALAAAEQGAQLANRVEVCALRIGRGRVDGVAARDLASGRELELRADAVLCCAGAESFALLGRERALRAPAPPLSRAANVVLARALFDCAVALPVSGAAAGQGEQTLFAAPWRGRTLLGTLHLPLREPGRAELAEAEIECLLAAVNRVLPGARLQRSDVALFHVGVQPVAGWDASSGLPRHAPDALALDHGARDRVAGLHTLVGVKFTEAPEEARRAVERIGAALGRGRAPAGDPPLPGARGTRGEALRRELRERAGPGFDAEQLEHLAASYGARATGVLEHARDPGLAARLTPASPVSAAELVFGLREEMAGGLGDLVLRRTELGARGDLDARALEACAEVASREQGWSAERRAAELACARSALAQRGAG